MKGFRHDRIPTSCIPDWDSQYSGWGEYQCSPYVTPKAGLHYVMHFGRLIRPVKVLGIFEELIVVRYNDPLKTIDGIVFEEAVPRHRASFFEIPSLGAEMTPTADTDAQPE